MTDGRHRAQAALRACLVVLVVLWLFSSTVRAWLPFWLPLLVLAAFEVEFVVRAQRERRLGAPTARGTRVGPGAEDADLGWGTLVEDEDGARWEPPPPRAPRPRGRRLLAAVTAVSAGVLVVVGVRHDASATWSSLPASERARTEARLTAEAARIADRPVELHCDQAYAFTGARSDALGIAFPRKALTYLHPSVCRSLHDVLAGDHAERDRFAEAILVLAHEAVHLRGERRESVTECLALQEGVALGRRLGLPADRAERLMRTRYLEALADRSVIRIAYQLPSSCVDGGALDVNPGTSRFP